VAVLAVLLCGVLGLFAVKKGPFDDTPVTQTAVAERAAAAATAAAQDTAVAQVVVSATIAAQAAQTSVALSGGTATAQRVAADALSTAAVVDALQTRLAQQSLQGTIAAGDRAAAATGTVIAVGQTKTAAAGAATAAAQGTAGATLQTKTASDQGTTVALGLQLTSISIEKTAQAKFDTQLTSVALTAAPAPPASPKPLLSNDAPAPARDGMAPVDQLVHAFWAGPAPSRPEAGRAAHESCDLGDTHP
jgi:trimeric autotransporter adhesin